MAEDTALEPAARDAAVSDLIELVAAVDDMLQSQSASDAEYFASSLGRDLTDAERDRVAGTLLEAYRFQYLVSGIARTRFPELLFGLAPLLWSVARRRARNRPRGRFEPSTWTRIFLPERTEVRRSGTGA